MILAVRLPAVQRRPHADSSLTPTAGAYEAGAREVGGGALALPLFVTTGASVELQHEGVMHHFRSTAAIGSLKGRVIWGGRSFENPSVVYGENTFLAGPPEFREVL
jgi:hypothetical protein